MLQIMREKMQGIIAGSIVAIICITFALWGVQYYLHSDNASTALAKVNNVEITPNQVRLGFERLRQQMMVQSGGKFTLSQKEQAEVKQKILQELIASQVVSQHLASLGFHIGDKQLQALVVQLPIFQVDGHFSLQRFQEVLSNMFYTEDAFFSNTRNSLLLNQLESGIVASAFLLPNDINTAVQLLKQKRDVNYLMIPQERFLKNVKVSIDEVQKYYQAHQDAFKTTERVSVSYLQLSADQLANKLGTVTVENLKQFYQDNIDAYSQPKRWQIAHLLIKTSDKNRFDTLVKEASVAGSDFMKLAPQATQVNWIASNAMSKG